MTEIYIGRYGPKLRDSATVRKRLRAAGIWYNPIFSPLVRRLTRTVYFDPILEAVKGVRKGGATVTGLRVPIPEIHELNLTRVTMRELEACVKDGTLHLTWLPPGQGSGTTIAPQQLTALIDAQISAATAAFDPSRIFDSIMEIISGLGFRSVQVWVPKGEQGENWVKAFVHPRWGRDGHTAYPPETGGRPPTSTLASVIQVGKGVYCVNLGDFKAAARSQGIRIEDLSENLGEWPSTLREARLPSFKHAGLTPSLLSIVHDLRLSKGSGQIIFICVVDQKTQSPVAVIAIHNRIPKTDASTPPPSPLPSTPAETTRVLFLLEDIFTRLVPAFQTASRHYAKASPSSAEMEATFNIETERELWDWAHGKGGQTLEGKISGAVTDAHRQDFVTAMAPQVRKAIEQGKTTIWEDAAGASPIVSLLLEELTEVTASGGPRVLPAKAITNLKADVRDFAPNAVAQATTAIAEAGFNQVVTIEQGDMFERSERDGESVDFVVASMAFYCTRERFRSALREWARIAKPGARGWFSMKAHDGDLSVVRNETIKAFMRTIPLWHKIFFPIFIVKMGALMVQRKRAGAFEYGKRLSAGFATGIYYAPTVEQLAEDLDATGLKLVTPQRSLANQFWLVEWEKPS